MLSGRPKQILEFIEQFLAENGYPPSVRQIQKGAKISSTSVVKYNLEKLAELGYIEHDKKTSRGLRLTGQGIETISALLRIPLLGRIAAGEPIPVPGSDFNVMPDKAITLTRDIIKDEDGLYALEVRGNSMIDALIHDGDVVVMKHAREARNGEMVAIWLKDKEETTLKRFYLEGGRVRLQPANQTMQPIYADPGNVEIQGRVVAVIRRVS